MCGRFTLTVSTEALQSKFSWLKVPEGAQTAPRYNIAPSQPVALVANTGENKLDFFQWGLIPSWAKDPKIAYKLINARSETAAEKPSFRAAFKRRRCVIFTDGFYEWHMVDGQEKKQPVYIHMKDGEPFAFAGLWEQWHSPHGDQLLTCTILTTSPNRVMEPYHNRMPVILDEQDFATWLVPSEVPAKDLQALMVPYEHEERMEVYPVSRDVNSPRNDHPDLILAVAS